jgi:hypothetical protein
MTAPANEAGLETRSPTPVRSVITLGIIPRIRTRRHIGPSACTPGKGAPVGLFTNRLRGRDKRRAGAARLQVSTPPVLPGAKSSYSGHFSQF